MNEPLIAIKVAQRPGCEDIPLPAYESSHASGMDLRAAVTGPLTIEPGARVSVPTGLHIALPPGTEAQVRPRSGLAIRHGISMINAPGTIDADYRGEICVLLVNLGKEPYVVRRGDRIAQMVIAPVLQARWEITENLDATLRGEGGFGSTGV